MTSPLFVAHGWEMHGMLPYLYYMANDTRYATAASHLSGSLVRIGGITADWTRYVGFGDAEASAPPTPRGGAPPRLSARASDWPPATEDLTLADFTLLLSWFNATGLRLLFDLNELAGRNCTHPMPPPCPWAPCPAATWCVGAWDTSGVRALLQHLHDARLVGGASPLVGFELGNELRTHLATDAIVADIRALAAIVDEVWADVPAAERPPLYAPSTDACADGSTAAVMTGVEGSIAGFSYHAYPGQDGTGAHALQSLLLNASWLRDGMLTGSQSQQCIDTWRGPGPQGAGMALWVTEASSSYAWTLPPPNQQGFIEGFFDVAQLGAYARTGVGLVARWAFSEGSPFALLHLNATRGAWDAAADFFLLVAYRRLVGSGVLAVVGDAGSDVLVFAHCTAASLNGSVTVFAANPSPVEQRVAVGGVGASTPRAEWVFTAPGGDLGAYTPLLNGDAAAPLRLAADGSLPPMPGAWVPAGGEEALVLPPQSQGFFVLGSAGALACGGCSGGGC